MRSLDRLRPEIVPRKLDEAENRSTHDDLADGRYHHKKHIPFVSMN
jgi:hypothetical protein